MNEEMQQTDERRKSLKDSNHEEIGELLEKKMDYKKLDDHIVNTHPRKIKKKENELISIFASIGNYWYPYNEQSDEKKFEEIEDLAK